jgi:hypothetical protein
VVSDRLPLTGGWTITDADETAIEQVPAQAWTDSPHQDGSATSTAHVAELTGLNQRLDNWNGTLRLTARRTEPPAPARQPAKWSAHARRGPGDLARPQRHVAIQRPKPAENGQSETVRQGAEPL